MDMTVVPRRDRAAHVRERMLGSTALTLARLAIIPVGVLAAAAALANPQGGQVVGGSAAIVQTSPTRLDAADPEVERLDALVGAVDTEHLDRQSELEHRDRLQHDDAHTAQTHGVSLVAEILRRVSIMPLVAEIR